MAKTPEEIDAFAKELIATEQRGRHRLAFFKQRIRDFVAAIPAPIAAAENKLPVPGPVSDTSIYHGPFKPMCGKVITPHRVCSREPHTGACEPIAAQTEKASTDDLCGAVFQMGRGHELCQKQKGHQEHGLVMRIYSNEPDVVPQEQVNAARLELQANAVLSETIRNKVYELWAKSEDQKISFGSAHRQSILRAVIAQELERAASLKQESQPPKREHNFVNLDIDGPDGI